MKKVTFREQTEAVGGGYISCLTTIREEPTKLTNGLITEISTFKCDCGNNCPETIAVTQKIFNDVGKCTDYTQITVSVDNFVEFQKAMKIAYDKIISKRN
jgi:hypothetical protein